MYYINLFFLHYFIGHGFCDFLPLLQTFDRNILINYIYLILINCYIHCLTPSFSTLIFVLLSSIHFSGDFFPYDKIKFPGLGLFVLGMPIIGDYKIYYEILEFINIKYIDLFLFLLFFGGILGCINNRDNILSYLYIIYILMSYFLGIKAFMIYMLYYHTHISICLLCKKYDMDQTFMLFMFGTFSSMFAYMYLYDFLEYLLFNYKNYIIGSIFGLLNSHSLSTLAWRYNEISLK